VGGLVISRIVDDTKDEEEEDEEGGGDEGGRWQRGSEEEQRKGEHAHEEEHGELRALVLHAALPPRPAAYTGVYRVVSEERVWRAVGGECSV
jgi:hypothetical protein